MDQQDQNVETPEIEEASAQKMPVGDEEQSVASVDKASDATAPHQSVVETKRTRTNQKVRPSQKQHDQRNG